MVLEDLLQEDEFALLEGPCDEIDKYKSIAEFTPTDPTVINKLKDVKNFSSVIVGAFDIHKIEDAAGNVVNMDEFSVQVNNLPNGMNAFEFIHHIRTNLNNFVNTDYGMFEPYNEVNNYPFDEAAAWNSHDPIGAIIHIEIPFDEGSVIVSDHSSTSWTFSTISAPFDGNHPVSGNREFGFTQNSNGSYTFYTKGVDRITDSINSILAKKPTFNGADNLWKSFQQGIKDYVNIHGGSASVNNPEILRPDWNQVQKVFNGTAGVNTLGCN